MAKAMTVKEAADSLGISTGKIYDLAAAGELVSFKIGRVIRISAKAVDDFIRTQEEVQRSMGTTRR